MQRQIGDLKEKYEKGRSEHNYLNYFRLFKKCNKLVGLYLEKCISHAQHARKSKSWYFLSTCFLAQEYLSFQCYLVAVGYQVRGIFRAFYRSADTIGEFCF